MIISLAVPAARSPSHTATKISTDTNTNNNNGYLERPTRTVLKGQVQGLG